MTGQTGQPKTVDTVTWSRFDGTCWWDRWNAVSLWQLHGSCSVSTVRRVWPSDWSHHRHHRPLLAARTNWISS